MIVALLLVSGIDFSDLAIEGELRKMAVISKEDPDRGGRPRATSDPDVLARKLAAATSVDAELVRALRSHGQRGVDAIVRANGDDAKINAVAAQFDAKHSRLFWHTDLNDAMRDAQRTHKPIVSLRMLGRLDEELSCANSRYFRALLYADPKIAKMLREKFVLHWQSVRPVPVVTVDMGDGRKFTTTLTGNSAHLILDENGKPIDAIPGMYAANAFATALSNAERAGTCKDDDCLVKHHAHMLAVLDRSWKKDITALGRPNEAPRPTFLAPEEDPDSIGPRAMAKAINEAPLIRRMGVRGSPEDRQIFRDVGNLRRNDMGFNEDAISRFIAGRDQEWVMQMIREIASDTAQNEQGHHRSIHQWFTIKSAATSTDASLQRAIYDIIFATPDSDPWLGLRQVREGAVIR